MSLFVVIRKSIKDGFFPSNTKNPTKKELLTDLKSYPQVYLLHSLDDAKKVAELFFHAPREPKVGGSYGLIAEVTAEFSEIPVAIKVDAAKMHNNWVNSQKLGYVKKENTGINCQCIIISPAQVKSISHTFIPENAQAYNSNLQDKDFTNIPSKCIVM